MKYISLKNIIYTSFILFCSCDMKNEPLDLFMDVETITDYEVVDLEQYNVLAISNFYKNDGYCVMLHPKDSTIITLVDTRTNKFLKGIVKGRGPNELLSATLIGLENGIAYLDVTNDKKICAIDIKESFMSGSIRFTIVESSFEFSGSAVNNQYIVGKGHPELDPLPRLILYNRMTKESGLYYEFPKYMKELTPIHKYLVDFNTKIELHPNSSSFISYDMRGIEFSIWQIEDDNKINLYKDFTFSIPHFHFDNNWIVYEKTDKLGIRSSCVSNSYVLFSYIGVTIDECLENSTFTKHLLVFDWEGNPVKRYILPLNSMVYCYDEKEKVLYATSDEHELIKYNLNI